MSQRNRLVPTDIDAMEPGGADYQYPPTQNQVPESNFSDGSEPLFSMYLDRAGEEDKKMAESWKADTEEILVFTGLFSAAVATLISISIQDLRPDPQDTTAFYLANIYQLLSSENGSSVVIPRSLSNPADSFTPSTAAVWVNSLWFLSLVISVTCALLATLLRQCARYYIRFTNPRYSLHKRARVRAFFAEGVERLHLPWMVDALPTLLHISLFLFFAGLSIFLFGIHQTVFKVVVSWVGLCVIVYAYVAVLPIVHKGCPYHSPLSTFIWFCLTGMQYAVFPALDIPRHNTTIPGSFHIRDPEEDRNRSLFPHSLLEAAEDSASQMPADIDYRALSWTFDSLYEDRELEQFFEGVPGFCNSRAMDDPVRGFIRPNDMKLSNALGGLMDRTLSSSLVSESVKQRRITIFTKANRAANLFGAWWVLPRVLLGEWEEFLRSIEFGLFLKDWDRADRPITIFYAQCAVAAIIMSVRTQARDERWLQLATRQINVSKSVLRNYLTHGDSILLVNLIYIVRQTLQTSSDIGKHYESLIKDASSRTLESVYNLDARDSLPELQHDFCGLWNELVRAAQADGRPHVRNLSLATLKNIRRVYIALHENIDKLPTAFTTTDDRDSALDHITSYPTCTSHSHVPTPPGGLSDLRGQIAQPRVSLPLADLPSHVQETSTTPMPFLIPSSSPPVPSTAQVFPVHRGARPTDRHTIHGGHSAPQAPLIGSSNGPSIYAPQVSLTMGAYPTQLDPWEDAYESKPSFS